MYRETLELHGDGSPKVRIEIERLSGGVEYRRYEKDTEGGTESLVEQRAATDEEIEKLKAFERDRRRSELRATAETGIDRLETVRDSSGTLTNDQLSDVLRTIAGVLAAFLRIALRKIDAS